VWRVRNGVGQWADPEPDAPPRTVAPWERRGKVVARPRLKHSDAFAAAVLGPDCPRCGNSLIWRGHWKCDACPATIGVAELERKLGGELHAWPVAVPPRAVRAAPIFSSEKGDNCLSSRTDREKWSDWLDQVEQATSWWRRSRAMRHRVKGARLFWQNGEPHGGMSHWHVSRETGQAERFQRIRECGKPWAVFRGVTESGKSVERTLEKHCDCWRICAKCLERRKFRLREGIIKQRKLALNMHKKQMSRVYSGKEGRWTEKLITLTVPHSDSPGSDARLMTRAWRIVSKKLTEHLKLDRECERAPVWVRALEIAPGQSGGHAHIHLWFFGPYIEHAWLRAIWGDALKKCGITVDMPVKSWADAIEHSGAVSMPSEVRARARADAARWLRTRRGQHGRERESVYWPVVDIRSPKGDGTATAAYAQKVGVAMYVAKVEKGVSSRVHPLHAASVYEGLESARAVQWCRGWAPKKENTWKVWTLTALSEKQLRGLEKTPNMAESQNANAEDDSGKQSRTDGSRTAHGSAGFAGPGNPARRQDEPCARARGSAENEHNAHAGGARHAGSVGKNEMGGCANGTRSAGVPPGKQLTLWKDR